MIKLLTTDEYLAEIKARAEDATPGPWYVKTGDDRRCCCLNFISTDPPRANWMRGESPEDEPEAVVAVTLLQYPYMAAHSSEKWDENSEFIAHAREDGPALLAEVERLANRNHELEKKVDQYRSRLRPLQVRVTGWKRCGEIDPPVDTPIFIRYSPQKHSVSIAMIRNHPLADLGRHSHDLLWEIVVFGHKDCQRIETVPIYPALRWANLNEIKVERQEPEDE